MLRRRGAQAAAGVAFALHLLAGCAIVDKYADRAVDYNLQAEKTQQQNLLLNIIRASLRRPMQFTGLTSITGTASASGTLGGGYGNTHQTPVVQDLNFPPGSTTSSLGTAIGRLVTGTGTASGTMSGGPTFTVPVLDTQEFYQGILQPLSPTIIDYYVKQGYQLTVLFNLFVASVEVIATDSRACERFTFVNDARDEVKSAQFQALADYLISSGFTTERISETRPFGPPITFTPGAMSAAEAARMLEAYSKASDAGLVLSRGRPEPTRAPRSTPNQNQSAPNPDQGSPSRNQSTAEPPHGQQISLQKRSSRYRFCFTRDATIVPRWLGPPEEQAYCGHASASRATRVSHGERCGILGGEQGGGEGGTSQFYDIRLSDALYYRLREIRAQYFAGSTSPESFFPIGQFQNHRVTFRFHVRSVEGILYYLGEITRQHLTPEDNKPRTMQIKTNLRYGSMPPEDCDSIAHGGLRHTKKDLRKMIGGKPDPRPYSCENLFVLESGVAPDAFYTVTYDGQTYSIPNDRDRAGRSLQVLELVKQLLALHISARQLPQSGVLSIIGGTAQ